MLILNHRIKTRLARCPSANTSHCQKIKGGERGVVYVAGFWVRSRIDLREWQRTSASKDPVLLDTKKKGGKKKRNGMKDLNLGGGARVVGRAGGKKKKGKIPSFEKSFVEKNLSLGTAERGRKSLLDREREQEG